MGSSSLQAEASRVESHRPPKPRQPVSKGSYIEASDAKVINTAAGGLCIECLVPARLERPLVDDSISSLCVTILGTIPKVLQNFMCNNM